MFVSNALITKVKTIHANDLKEDDYNQLLKKKSIHEIVSYLKDHKAYKDILADIPAGIINRSYLELLIRKQKFNQMIRIIKFIRLKDFSFYALGLLHQEHEVILSLIRSFISNEQQDIVGAMPVYFDKYTKINFKAISLTNNLTELVEALKGTKYYEMMKPYIGVSNDDIKYYEFETLFEMDYYNYAFDTIGKNYKGKLKKELEDTFKSRIEMENMIKVYRLKKFYKVSDKEIKSMLIPSSRITEKRMDELISIKDPNLIFDQIIKKGLGFYMGDKDQVYLEYFGDHLKFHIANKYMYYATDPAKVYLGYMILSELEISNLTHLIEGIRYEVSESEIRTMMVF